MNQELLQLIEIHHNETRFMSKIDTHKESYDLAQLCLESRSDTHIQQDTKNRVGNYIQKHHIEVSTSVALTFVIEDISGVQHVYIQLNHFLKLLPMSVNVMSVSVLHRFPLQDSIHTSALKMVRWAFGDIDLLSEGISDCNKHTIDIHCPLFSESPTNISLLPLNFSHISFTFHLFQTTNM